MEKTRREFLKKLGFAGSTAAVAATAAYSAGSNLKSGKSKKNEVLYTRSKTWEFYYQQAK